jgi:DNA-binding NarL/FixJ family response regulator
VSRIRVLVADDHPLYRAGLRTMLASDPALEIVGEAASVPETRDLVSEQHPDVLVLDVAMPGGDGIAAARRLAVEHPEVAVLVLTMFDDVGSITRAVHAGVAGYLVKGAGGDEVLRAVHAVASGQVILDGRAGGAAALGAAPGGVGVGALTERERDVLRLMARGLTNPAIAESVYLSEKTVRNYVSSIFRKLGAENRVEAVRLAREAGVG